MITDSNNRFNPGYTQGSWVASGLFAVAAHPHRIQARNTFREECSKAYLVPDSFSTKGSFPKQIRCTTTKDAFNLQWTCYPSDARELDFEPKGGGPILCLGSSPDEDPFRHPCRKGPKRDSFRV